MTLNNFYEQKLRITDSSPVYIKNYRLPHSQKSEINNQVQNLLQNDLIEPSHSDYNSSYRMCVDFRALNKKLVADKFPLSRVDEILDDLSRAKYFSIIDF